MNDKVLFAIIGFLFTGLLWFIKKLIQDTEKKIKELEKDYKSFRTNSHKQIESIESKITLVIEDDSKVMMLNELATLRVQMKDLSDLNERIADNRIDIIRHESILKTFNLIAKSHNNQLQELFRLTSQD